VSFEVKRGEVLGVIGGNGAGKSTLLKIISQITAPTSGRIRIKGRVASLLEIGTGFHPELTGRENTYLNGAILGMKKAEVDRKFDEIVAFSEVEQFMDTPVKRYSSGMYVRLAFAVAAHLDPEILLVDEVLAVGDAKFQKKCLGKIGDVAKGGRTVLFVSHNMGAVETLCEKGVLLDKGGVDFCGNSRAAISKYLGDSQLKASTPLMSRVDRKGSGWVRITEIAVGLKDQPRCGYWRTGEDCVVWFKYQVTSSSPAGPIDVGFVLVDSRGRKLLWANTVVAKRRIDLTGRLGVIYCRIRRFPLAPGDYYLGCDIYDSGGLVDDLDNAVVVPVESGEGVGTWQAWGGYGTTCADYQWGCA
jgi:lipopolysaccharide transport system ATP-binding protein